jgi:hypothetical protein
MNNEQQNKAQQSDQDKYIQAVQKGFLPQHEDLFISIELPEKDGQPAQTVYAKIEQLIPDIDPNKSGSLVVRVAGTDVDTGEPLLSEAVTVDLNKYQVKTSKDADAFFAEHFGFTHKHQSTPILQGEMTQTALFDTSEEDLNNTFAMEIGSSAFESTNAPQQTEGRNPIPK